MTLNTDLIQFAVRVSPARTGMPTRDPQAAAFELLEASNGQIPAALSPPHATLNEYLAAIDRDCAREMHALVKEWRVPDAGKWGTWPPSKEEGKLLGNTLVAIPVGGEHNKPAELVIRLVVIWQKQVQLHPASLLLSRAVGAQAASLIAVQRVVPYLWRQSYRSIGYIGDLVSAWKATAELRCALTGGKTRTGGAPALALLGALRSNGAIANGDWMQPLAAHAMRSMPLNVSQHAALAGLSQNLQLIRGPPGTGKSTTIYALVVECVPKHESVLICAVQNKAIEALAEKFVMASTGFIVVGRRATGVAMEWTLDAQVARDPHVLDTAHCVRRIMLVSQRLRAWLERTLRLVFNPVPSVARVDRLVRAASELADFRRKIAAFRREHAKAKKKAGGRPRRNGKPPRRPTADEGDDEPRQPVPSFDEQCFFDSPEHHAWMQLEGQAQSQSKQLEEALRRKVLAYVKRTREGWARLARAFGRHRHGALAESFSTSLMAARPARPQGRGGANAHRARGTRAAVHDRVCQVGHEGQGAEAARAARDDDRGGRGRLHRRPAHCASARRVLARAQVCSRR
jgi:DNA polymerase III delta prime subunit